jgi:hypothetical protein|tara:strand:- start:1276 stop:2004 length:729 start_codon:yes stop_codon:yes gene_type:complete
MAINQNSLSSEEILDLYRGLQQQPVSKSDVDEELFKISTLFPNPRRQNIFDLASALSAGLAAQAASGQPPSIAYGLTAGFNSFNEGNQIKRIEADKIKQQAKMMAYQQAEAKKERELEFSKDILEKQFELSLKSGGFMEGTGDLASALNFIARAEKNPALRNTLEYKLALAVAERSRASIQQTEQGAVPVTQPGLDVQKVLKKFRGEPTNTITDDDGVVWTPTDKVYDDKTVYTDGTNEAVF